MNYFTSKAASSVLCATLALGAAGAGAATTTITSNTFSALSTPGWSFGSQLGGSVSISKDTTQNYNGGATSIVGTYPIPGSGGMYVWGGYDVSALKTEELYIEFWAKMPKAKYGVKFLKIFGGTNGSGYANTTFGLDYTGIDYGSMYQISFGDGSSTGNDTQNVIYLDGSNPSMIGRSYGKASVSTPPKARWASSNWGTSWHHFKVHLKFNSGTTAANEIADGAYYLEIDGKVYVNATGLLNRHYSNPPIDRVGLFDWSQGGGSSPFEIWYSNFTISTGGFASSTTTTAPPAAPSLSVTPN